MERPLFVLDDAWRFSYMNPAGAALLGETVAGLVGRVLWEVYPETLDSPFELMGLFSGIGLTEDGATPHTGQLPNTVFLYRRAILDYWAEHDDNTLGEVVTHVLIHELGHHFGFSDEDMEEIEARAEAED